MSAETRWTSVRGESYEVVTDAGVAPAIKMAYRAEQMHQLLGGRRKVLPLRVVLLESRALYAALRPSGTAAGYFQSGADGDWIAVEWGRPDSERAMSHELVHAYLEHSGPRRPLWLEEGLAEFYSTAELQKGQWTIGRPVESHVRLLNQRAWMGEREFFEARHDSPVREEGSRIGVFYAQSWAVVHFLLTVPGIREKTPALFAALEEGASFAQACERSIGLRPGLLLEAARRGLEGRRFLTARIAADAGPGATPAASILNEEAAEEMLVSLALASGKPEVARRWAKSTVQKGLLAIAAGENAAARQLLEAAVAAGTPNPAPYFELALLLRESGGQGERVAALLRAAIERNPAHAEAHFLLGLRAAAAGDLENAIGYYQTAARILPRQATFWHTLALALEQSNRTAEASHAAVRCRLAARNPAEREMAAGVARLIQTASREPAPPRPAVRVPESWQGLRGDASAEGLLTSFDCGSQPPVATVESGVERLALQVARPEAIRISGTGQVRHTFACGPQRTAVRVEYRRETRELTAIEFR